MEVPAIFTVRQLNRSIKTYTNTTSMHCNTASLRKQETMYRLPFLFVLLLLAVDLSPVAAVVFCSPSDRAALLEFKEALDEPYLGVFKTWTGNNCCQEWHGVSCDPFDGRVADISLRGESEDPIILRAGRPGFMTGSLSPSICRLDRLSNLIISDWKNVTGEIPRCISSLSFLRVLDLVGNRLSGQIPWDIGKLIRLTVLNFADNELTGQIPPSITSIAGLMHLDFSRNRLSGPIPKDIGNMRMLSRLLLRRNYLSGEIPTSVALLDRLADLDLMSNLLTGSIPWQIGKMSVLSSLYLSDNRISGQIPSDVLRMEGLSIMNVSQNRLSGNIPDVFGPHSYFTALDLSYNSLTGPIPTSLTSAAFIGHLDLSHNHLCGHIPQGSPFDHLEAPSFAFNDCLCGSPLHSC